MSDAVTLLTNAAGPAGSIAAIGAAIALAFITLAATLPKILNSMKSDKLDGNVLTRVANLETKAIAQDAKIHRYAVRVTRLTVLVMRLHALLAENKVSIPQDLIDEIVELTKEVEDDVP